jgi:hypothetical protein
MLFHATVKTKVGMTHEDQKKTLAIWANWQPPEGIGIKMHVLGPDGGGGFVLFEADSSEAVLEGIAPSSAVIMDYEIVPVVEVEAGVAILEKGIAAREAA